MHDYLSFAFLLLLPTAVAAWILKASRQPSEYSFWERILYAPVYCLGRILWRVEVVGGITLSQAYPKGAVIIANHRCSLDPFFLQIAAGRRVHWMVAGEYFRNPIFGPVLRIFQAIPTNRTGADNASMKMAIRLASEGRFVGMFPEGRINRSNKPLHKIRPGAALVATKANAPLLPCWIDGAPSGWAVWSGLFMAAHVRVFVGQAIPTTASSVEASDDLIVRAMQASLALVGHSPEAVELGGAKSRRR
jgi:1-acyl-sn-glycerol-3-phosphate acyltransferase